MRTLLPRILLPFTAVVFVILIVFAFITGLTPETLAEESPASPPTLTQDQAQAIWDEASALLGQNQQAAAANRYMEIVTGVAPSLRSAQAGLRAGHAYTAANQQEEALTAYNSVISAAESLSLENEPDRVTLNRVFASAVGGKARILTTRGQHEEAGALYGSLVTPVLNRRGPLHNITYARAMGTIEAAHEAAASYERAGKYAEAVTYYDAIITIAEAKGYEEDTQNKRVVYQLQNNLAAALYDKAKACMQAGQLQTAQDAISRMRAEFVDCPAAVEIRVLEAQLSGSHPGQAQALSLNEANASEQLKEIGRLERWGLPPDDVAARLDHVIASYPQTAAALRAQEAKGRSLKEQGRFQQAEETFTQLMQELGEPAFKSRLYQTAWLQYAESRFKRLHELNRQRRRVSDQAWDELRGLFTEIRQRGMRPLDRATAHFLLIETYGLQDKLPEMLQETNNFLIEHNTERKIERLPGHVMWVNYFAAMCLKRMERYEEALAHLRWITHYHETTGNAPPNPVFMPLVYYRVWETLRTANAPPGDLDQAAFQLTQRYPYSDHARLMAAQAAR